MTVVLILALILPLGPSHEMLAPDGHALTDADRARIEAGKVLVRLTEVPESGVKKAVAIGLVDAVPEEVFAVITDYDHFTLFMPYCETVKVQERDGENSTVYFSLNFPWPIGDRYYVLNLVDRSHEVADSEVFTSSWTYKEDSGNIKDSFGSWEVRAYDDQRSFVRYVVCTDPGGSIPNWAKNAATEIAIPKVFKGLRARVIETRPQRVGPQVDQSRESTTSKSRSDSEP